MKTAAERTIVAAGYAASGRTGELAEQAEEILYSRYHQGFVERAKHTKAPDENILRALSQAEQFEVRVYSTKDLGVYDTLWRIGEENDCGLIVDALQLPVLPETVEVCEASGCDPFALPSDGLVFLLTETPMELTQYLRSKGCPAEVIGRVTSEKARILTVGERKRYLARAKNAAEETADGAD